MSVTCLVNMCKMRTKFSSFGDKIILYGTFDEQLSWSINSRKDPETSRLLLYRYFSTGQLIWLYENKQERARYKRIKLYSQL